MAQTKTTLRPPKRPDDGIPKPKSLKEWPRYLGLRISGFFSRLFYIVSLVWEAAPPLLFVMAALCIFDGVLPVVGAYISKELLNEIQKLIELARLGQIAESFFSAMKPLLFLFSAYFIYQFLNKILSRVNTMVTTIAGELVVNHIKLKIINKAKATDLGSFDRPEFYEKLENANREAGMRPIYILNSTFAVISAAISALSFIVVLATLSPLAPVIIILAAIPGALVNFFYRNKNYRYLRIHSKERRQMNYYSNLMVNKDMVKEVKILGLGDTFVDKYENVFERYYKGLKRLILKEGFIQMLVALISTAVSCSIFVYIAYNVIYNDGQIGDYSLYTGALTSIAAAVATLLNSTANIYEGTLFINNMMDFMKEEETVVPLLPEPLKAEKGVSHTIEFKNVSFAYPGSDKNVLSGINLKMEGNDSVVLVGLNGAGKTTFIKLLTRLYDPTEGVILLDGEDIRKYDTASLYDLFGIIFQDYGKYSESVSENIRYGDVRREYTEVDIASAAKNGNADGFIDKLPMKYETPLTRMFEEDGTELSGGQWQKLSVARAFFKESDILILDEPTASLDAIAEREVFDSFEELSKSRLTVYVSHRLSSATTANKIVVIGEGRIVETGTHEELMEKGGEYYRLFSTQAERYQDIITE